MICPICNQTIYGDRLDSVEYHLSLEHGQCACGFQLYDSPSVNGTSIEDQERHIASCPAMADIAITIAQALMES